jgi:hypothetical protein
MSTVGIMEVGPPGGVVPVRLTYARLMGWMLWFGSLAVPRMFILGFWVFGRQLGDAFSSWVIPAVGFLVAPWTTVAYALMWGLSSDKVAGAEWIVVGVAVVLDLATWLGGRALARPR